MVEGPITKAGGLRYGPSARYHQLALLQVVKVNPPVTFLLDNCLSIAEAAKALRIATPRSLRAIASLVSAEYRDRAEQACSACKKLKRKCDQSLPKCSLCERTGRHCDYAEVTSQLPSATEFAAVQARVAELEGRLAVGFQSPETTVSDPKLLPNSSERQLPSRDQDRFPAALFLDIDCYNWGRITIAQALC